jgi:hypothetical protein
VRQRRCLALRARTRTPPTSVMLPNARRQLPARLLQRAACRKSRVLLAQSQQAMGLDHVIRAPPASIKMKQGRRRAKRASRAHTALRVRQRRCLALRARTRTPPTSVMLPNARRQLPARLLRRVACRRHHAPAARLQRQAVLLHAVLVRREAIKTQQGRRRAKRASRAHTALRVRQRHFSVMRVHSEPYRMPQGRATAPPVLLAQHVLLAAQNRPHVSQVPSQLATVKAFVSHVRQAASNWGAVRRRAKRALRAVTALNVQQNRPRAAQGRSQQPRDRAAVTPVPPANINLRVEQQRV